MKRGPILPGTVLWVALPLRRPPGHEQVGMRPCLVLADPAAVQPVRFPVLVVAPLTSRVVGEGPLYVRLPAGTGGLPAASTVLLDQVSAIDAGRVRGYIGRIEGEPFRAIISGLRLLFGL